MEHQASGHATTSQGTRLRRARDAGLWLREGGLGLLGIAIALGCAGSGWYDSFIGLHQFAMDHMGLSSRDAWFVPLTFDGGALGLMLVVARAAMHGRGAIVWRLGVFALTGLSSWINWQHISDNRGQPIAALLPVVSACVFEGLMDEARKSHERRTGTVRPRLSLLRWVFDFQGTKAILRAYVLGQPLPDGLAEAAAEVADEKEQQESAKPARRKTTTVKPAVERSAVAATPAPAAEQAASNLREMPAPGTPTKKELGIRHVVALIREGRPVKSITPAEIDRATGSNGYFKKHMDDVMAEALRRHHETARAVGE